MKRSLQCFAFTTGLTFLFANSLNAAIGLPILMSGKNLQVGKDLQAHKNLLTDIPLSPRFSLLSLRFTPPPPPNRGAPGNRGEGASRGDCTAGDQPLTALVPSYEQPISSTAAEPITMTQVWGLTSVEHPSFWFYVPYGSDVIRQIEFVLQTEQNQTLYRLPVPIPTNPGIVEVKLPSTETALAVDQPYHWFFKVRVACNSEPITGSAATGSAATGSAATGSGVTGSGATLEYVEGWIQRVSLDAELTDRLTQASALQRAALYAENGVWYDALTTTADLHRANPEDATIAADWTELLGAIGLENLATQPIVDFENQ